MTKDHVNLLTASERYLQILDSFERFWAIPNGNESVELCWTVLNTLKSLMVRDLKFPERCC